MLWESLMLCSSASRVLTKTRLVRMLLPRTSSGTLLARVNEWMISGSFGRKTLRMGPRSCVMLMTLSSAGMSGMLRMEARRTALTLLMALRVEVRMRLQRSACFSVIVSETVLAKALGIMKRTLEEKNRLIEEQRPMAELGRQVSGSDENIMVGEMAKILYENGIEIGRRRLFKWLRENGYIFKQSREPMQKWIERGIMAFESVMSAINAVTEIANMLSGISAGVKTAETAATVSASTA